MTQTDTCFI